MISSISKKIEQHVIFQTIISKQKRGYNKTSLKGNSINLSGIINEKIA